FRRLVPGFGRGLAGKPQHDGDLPGRPFKKLRVAIDDDVFRAVGFQRGSDHSEVLLVPGHVGDRVVGDEVPSHEASGWTVSGKQVPGSPSYYRLHEPGHAGGRARSLGHFTAIASTSMRNSGRASRATPRSVSAGLWSPNSSILACSMTGRYSGL